MPRSRLRGLAGLAERLSAALERGDAAGVDAAARRLAVVSAGAGVARAQRRGALAYNRELREQNDLRAAVAEELARLQRELEWRCRATPVGCGAERPSRVDRRVRTS